MRRKTEIHRHHGGFMATHHRQRGLAIASSDRFILIESPAHLFLQRRVVLDDEQVPRCFVHAASLGSLVGATLSCPSGNTRRTRVPTSGVLSTRIRPPSPVTYCALSYTPTPMPVALVVWKGLNNRSRTNSGVMPTPLSVTSMTAASSSRRSRTETRPLPALASSAFCTKCPITCSSWST